MELMAYNRQTEKHQVSVWLWLFDYFYFPFFLSFPLLLLLPPLSFSLFFLLLDWVWAVGREAILTSFCKSLLHTIYLINIDIRMLSVKCTMSSYLWKEVGWHILQKRYVCVTCVYCSSTLHFVSDISYSFINYSFIKATP